MRKPYPPSERCPKCGKMVGGTASQPGQWYCDYDKIIFNKEEADWANQTKNYNLVRPGSC